MYSCTITLQVYLQLQHYISGIFVQLHHYISSTSIQLHHFKSGILVQLHHYISCIFVQLHHYISCLFVQLRHYISTVPIKVEISAFSWNEMSQSLSIAGRILCYQPSCYLAIISQFVATINFLQRRKHDTLSATNTSQLKTVYELCALPGCYAAYSDNSLSTLGHNLWAPSKFQEFLNCEEGTDTLYRNVGKELLLYVS